MHDKHLYLSLIPQALIASMLTPEEFGAYYAVGEKVHVKGDAIFFELDPSYRSVDFPFELVDERCVPGPNGEPKKSVYLAIYQVLSRIPISALGNLYLVTDDGRTLELKKEEYVPEQNRPLHLYQEFCPISPMVASRLPPDEFAAFITDPDNPVSVPRVVFSELVLNGLATDPEHGAADDLPYPSIEHIRDVLIELRDQGKQSKLVLKSVKQGVLYRTVHRGFYVGDHTHFAFYRFPSIEELESEHLQWWRSAQITHQS